MAGKDNRSAQVHLRLVSATVKTTNFAIAL